MTNDVPEYKFQKLDVYQLALEYVDTVYELSHQMPDTERFNLRSQIERAAASFVLNIAEGSTGQSDMEQNRFLGMALRSYIETVACIDLIALRAHHPGVWRKVYRRGRDGTEIHYFEHPHTGKVWGIKVK